MSKANAEQKVAIEHSGGVLLKAGAGSGKTFVLVEHILYLTNIWIKEFQDRPQGNFDDFIRQKFSQVVMMTFTKKAAGEMSIRLADKFLEKASSEGEDQSYWEICQDSLPLLTVTTIDGFCRKLITGGYFPGLSTEAQIIFTPQRLEQIEVLFEKWFENNLSKIDETVLEVVIREKKKLLNAMSSIFSDPSLRMTWKSFDFDEINPEKIGRILESSFYLNQVDSALAAIHALDLPCEADRSAFEKTVALFQSTGLPIVNNSETLNLYFNLFEPIKRLVGESAKKKTPAHEKAKDGLAELRTWVRTWKGVIDDYVTHFDGKILPWIKLCLNVFEDIDQKLDPNQGMTFGDIEYYVAQGLKDSEVRSRINKSYTYFIVDEFQDTSSLQFSIIRSLIAENFSRLFCVGDAKQAIYGFRGGELSVFQDCSELVPNVFTLANNYRSLPHVIEFNNSLFRTVLPSGQGYEGSDPFTVAAEDQRVPSEVAHENLGEIEMVSLAVRRPSEDKKLSTDQVNLIEANIIAESIEQQRLTRPNETCTVLYTRLKPSGNLIRALIKKKIGFTAQFKIDLKEDPLVGIFLVLLKRKFDKNLKTKISYPLLLIKSYFSILDIDLNLNEDDLLRFEEETKYWGIFEGFKKFIHRLGITNENADLNLEVIETLCQLYNQDPESLLVEIDRGEGQKVSLDFRYGTKSHYVQLMTAHASKGLEFETVYLGGIYTNGRELIDSEMFGTRPGSFYWYLDVGRREKQKSPQYLYESELSRYKSFSESKRLFYVACTRAKKKLVWVELDGIQDAFSIPKNSWIDGIHFWMNSGPEFFKNVNRSSSMLNIDDFLKDKSSPHLPLFFYDSVGIFSKMATTPPELLIAAELSVTRLNSLVDCPRKFYLENILKLTPTKEIKSFSFNEIEGDEVSVRSSAARGTQIHAEISLGIEHNFIADRAASSTERKVPVQWALDQLKDLSTNYNFISEKPMKFRLFNFMISGIPDLLLLPKTDDAFAQVWDFKTGKASEENLAHYWTQLKVYAYGLYQTGKISSDTKIQVTLCFVDQEKLLSHLISFEEVKEELFILWQSQNEPWKIKADHCTQCSYGDICPR